MAGLDVIPVQDAITEYVRTEFPAYDVYEDGVLDDDFLIKQGGNIKPYIVITHGMPTRLIGNGSFSGVRHDQYTCSFDVTLVAPVGKQVRQAMNLIHDRLVGWKPTGGGALVPFASGGPWAVVDAQGATHVYTGSIRFEYPINSENPGQPITP